MKKLFLLILGSLLISVQTFSQAADQEAIKKVCKAETQAFLDSFIESVPAARLSRAKCRAHY